MQLIPWSRIYDWFCSACGQCCKEFRVPLRAYEAVQLSKIFGSSCLELDVGSPYIRRRLDGRCIFQAKEEGKMICSIQPLKPLACKMWPFVVCETPRYEYRDDAAFDFRGETFYVYVNTYCKGVIYGHPSSRLVNLVIPEFVELKLGLRNDQIRSTSTKVKILSPLLKVVPSILL